MKSKYKYFVSAALSGLFGLLVAFSASAQHRGGGGGSRGGAVHSSGGFHGGGRPTMSRPAPGRGNAPASRGNSPVVRNTPRGNAGGRISSAPRANTIIRGNVGGRGTAVIRGGVNRGGIYRPGLYGRGRYANRFYGHGAFYNHNYLPRLGFRINVLPFGYYPFFWGDYQYYYSDGYYYQQDHDDYTIVEPPIGAILNQLPAGATSIMIDGQQYYELNGVYYQAVTQDNGNTGYQIAGKDGELSTGAGTSASDQSTQAAPVVGDVVNALPTDCNTVKINGQKYYVSPDGYYYQEDHDSSNRLVYRVAGTPTDEPSN